VKAVRLAPKPITGAIRMKDEINHPEKQPPLLGQGVFTGLLRLSVSATANWKQKGADDDKEKNP
jgi:hypothetical protein